MGEPGQDRDLSYMSAARYKRDYYVHQGGNNNCREVDNKNCQVEMKISKKKVRNCAIIATLGPI